MKTNIDCAVDALEEVKMLVPSQSFGNQMVRRKVELALDRLKRVQMPNLGSEDWAMIVTGLVYISDHALEGWTFEERAVCLSIAGRLREGLCPQEKQEERNDRRIQIR